MLIADTEVLQLTTAFLQEALLDPLQAELEDTAGGGPFLELLLALQCERIISQHPSREQR